MRFVIFCHSLKSCWNHGNAHFLRGIASELLARGHQVAVWESQRAWSRLNLVAEHGEAALSSYREAYPQLEIHEWPGENEGPADLDQVLNGADVVLVHEWSEPALVSRVGQHRKLGGRYLLLFHDTHHRSVSAPLEMAAYDLSGFDAVLAFGEHIRERYLKQGWARQVFCWHEAADVRVFRPLPSFMEFAPEPGLTLERELAQSPQNPQTSQNLGSLGNLGNPQNPHNSQSPQSQESGQRLGRLGRKLADSAFPGTERTPNLHSTRASSRSQKKSPRPRETCHPAAMATLRRGDLGEARAGEAMSGMATVPGPSTSTSWNSLREGELVWVGNWGDGEREAELEEFLLEPVKALGLRANVYGVRYSLGALDSLKEHGLNYGGWTPNHHVPKHFAAHRVTVHIPRGPYRKALPGIPTIRPFEAMACGIPLVSAPWDDVEGLFQEGRDYLLAKNGSEMREHLRALMADADMRQELAQQGRNTILLRHTCGHRVDELMQILETLGKASEQERVSEGSWISTESGLSAASGSSVGSWLAGGAQTSKGQSNTQTLNSRVSDSTGSELRVLELESSGSGMSDSRNPDSRYSDFRNSDSRFSASGILDSRTSESGTSGSGFSGSGFSDSGFSDSRSSDSRSSDSRFSDSRFSDSRLSDSRTDSRTDFGTDSRKPDSRSDLTSSNDSPEPSTAPANRSPRPFSTSNRSLSPAIKPLKISFFGSSLVSAYWNGAATYYRGILRALASRGHQITFYEPDAYQRQQHRDIPDPEWAKVVVYAADTEDQVLRCLEEAKAADLVVKASGVGVFDGLLEREVARLKAPGRMVAFWDVDAPATLQRVRENAEDPFHQQIPRFDWIFTYGGGAPVVEAYRKLGAQRCVPIYNALDPHTHHPCGKDPRFNGSLGFLGNRLPDREARVEEFFLRPAATWLKRKGSSQISQDEARSFVLGGNGWGDKKMPQSVRYVGHVYTRDHNAFNSSTLAVLNVNRSSMAQNGFSPATRVFEATGAGACLITDAFEGIEEFLEPNREVLVASSGDEVLAHLEALTAEKAKAIGEAARQRVLAEHTYEHRARQLDALWS